MKDYLKKIIDNIKNAKNNFGIAKKEVGNWHEQLGRFERETGLQEDFWEELGEQYEVPPAIASSAQDFSENLLEYSDNILKNIRGIKIKDLMSSTGAIADTTSSLAVSGAAFSCNPKEIYNLASYKKIESVLSQKNQQENISQKLYNINSSLAQEYNNAWTSLHTLPTDETRAPMFLIREVINHLIHYFAPKGKVKDLYGIENEKDVNRADQIKYLSCQIKDPYRKKVFLNAEKSFNKIYGLLCKAHKGGKLDIKETEGFLYQTDALIKLIIDSLQDDRVIP